MAFSRFNELPNQILGGLHQAQTWLSLDLDKQKGNFYLSSLALTLLVIYFVHYWLASQTPLLLFNGGSSVIKSKKNFMINARSILNQGLSNAAGKPFRVIADIGEVIILPAKYAHEIRNNDNFSFTKAAFKWFYADLPGFEGFREGTNESQMMKLVARRQLTHQLMLVTKAVSEECADALQSIYTDNDEWHEITVKECSLRLMSRITSRVFLGDKLCRDPEWLHITTMYTVIAFQAVEELRTWPSYLRPIVQWWLPKCTASRALVKDARRVVGRLIEKRQAEKEAAVKEGKEIVFNDAIEWLEEIAKEVGSKYEPAYAQLSLSVASIHSTTDFFTQAILDIIHHPEMIEPLREEIKAVIGSGNWTKNSLYHLKLMDSVLKESQRLKPIAIASMRRLTECDVTLTDGVLLPKNHLTLVSAERHWSPDFYENPNTFDGYRFFNMRNLPGKENVSQLVSVNSDHLGFGFGAHACPGRFFASEEIKIALCHILMKYDFEIVSGIDIEPRRYGFSMLANPTAKIRIRRRKEEIDI